MMVSTEVQTGQPQRVEQSRARYPDEDGYVERDGVRIFYELYGEGERTVLFLPTWSIVHSRHWKAQIPYFARHHRVLTFDGRGNGRSDRPRHRRLRRSPVRGRCPRRHGRHRDRHRAACRALGRGALGTPLAADHPERVDAVAYIGAAVPLVPGIPRQCATVRRPARNR